MSRLAALTLVACSAGGRPPLAAQTMQTKQVMRQKLAQSQQLLAALVTSNWASLGSRSRDLEALTSQTGWDVLRLPEFNKQTMAFQRAVQTLAEASNSAINARRSTPTTGSWPAAWSATASLRGLESRPSSERLISFSVSVHCLCALRGQAREVVMIWIGTSGYNYPEWKGSFYPADLPAAKMLPYYAERFPTVEINYTFYRMPNEKIRRRLEQRDARALQLTLKAPKRITHDRAAARLRRSRPAVSRDRRRRSARKLGALLFQLPPNLKKDLALFDAFLDTLPPRVLRRVRVPPRVVARRRRLRAPARTQPGAVRRRQREASTPVVITADYGYFRLRDEGYTADDIARWADVIREHDRGVRDVFVYFKHEDEGKGAGVRAER